MAYSSRRDSTGDHMRLRVQEVMPGPGPDELIVEVRTSAGILEEIVVPSAEVEHGTIEVG
jgi:hypothetical protein